MIYPRNLDALTGVRGFAAIWVVLYHLRKPFLDYFGPDSFVTFIFHGYLGVDLFAFVSGFIIAYTYSEQLGTLRLKPTLHFLWLRFARTYPLHIFVLALLAVYFAIQRDLGLKIFLLLPYDAPFMRQVFLLNGLGLETIWAWNVPSWTLSSEWFCYLLFPFLVPLIIRRTQGFGALGCAVLLLTATSVFMYSVGKPDFSAFLDWGLFRIIGEFFTGCFLYRAYASKTLFTRFAGVIGFSLLMFSIYILSTRPALPVVLAIFCFAGFTYCLAQGCQPLEFIFNNRISVYLGEISYSIYMLHWLVLLNEFTLGLDKTPLLFRPWLLLVLVLVASALTYEVVERPTRKWLRTWFKPAADS